MVRFSDDDFSTDHPLDSFNEEYRRRMIAQHVRSAEYGKEVRKKSFPKPPEPTPEERLKAQIMEEDRDAKRRLRRERKLLENLEDTKAKLDGYKSQVRSAFALNVGAFFLMAGGVTAGFFTNAMGYGAFGLAIITLILFVISTIAHLMIRYPGGFGDKPDYEEEHRNAQRLYNRFLMDPDDLN